MRNQEEKATNKGTKRFEQLEKDLKNNKKLTLEDTIFYICYCQAFRKKSLLK